jgi:hypothetical protein
VVAAGLLLGCCAATAAAVGGRRADVPVWHS